MTHQLYDFDEMTLPQISERIILLIWQEAVERVSHKDALLTSDRDLLNACKIRLAMQQKGFTIILTVNGFSVIYFNKNVFSSLLNLISHPGIFMPALGLVNLTLVYMWSINTREIPSVAWMIPPIAGSVSIFGGLRFANRGIENKPMDGSRQKAFTWAEAITTYGKKEPFKTVYERIAATLGDGIKKVQKNTISCAISNS